jgi:hypothetical protein
MHAGLPVNVPIRKPCAALQLQVGALLLAMVVQAQPLVQMPLGLQVVMGLQLGGGATGVPG